MNLEKIRTIILKECHLASDRPLLLGISGGPDSLALLDILLQFGFKMIAAHYDHQLRPESANESELVRKMVEDRDCKFVEGRSDVEKQSRENHHSIEEQARISRYQFLFEQASQYGCQAVAVAHTADDQVETILMHFLRGTGLHGLTGMSFRSDSHGWHSSIPLVRPLLASWREEIEEYCTRHHLEPIRDPSNQLNLFTRNRIRNELVPLLETYNPGIKPHLLNLSYIVHDEMVLMESEVRKMWHALVKSQGNKILILKREGFLSLSMAHQHEIIRKIYWSIESENRNLGFDAVQQIIGFIQKPSRSDALNWVAQIKVFINDQKIYFYIGDKLPPDDQLPQIILPFIEWNLEIPLLFENDWMIRGEYLPYSPVLRRKKEFKQPYHVWMDSSRMHFPLNIRQWKIGDFFHPLGLGGKSQKLSNFWINQHIPRNARQYYPLVISGEEIVWIPGLGTSENTCLTKGTKKVCHLFIEKVVG